MNWRKIVSWTGILAISIFVVYSCQTTTASQKSPNDIDFALAILRIGIVFEGNGDRRAGIARRRTPGVRRIDGFIALEFNLIRARNFGIDFVG